MITRSDLSPVKSRRLVNLEKSWNDTRQISNQPRRHAQMTKDIRKFVLQSVDGEIHQAERAVAAKSRHMEGTDIFSKISTTLNFTHHEHTDPKAEMKVVKIILIREGQVMTLQHLSDKTRTVDDVSATSSRVLDVLAEIRESTLNYLEALCLWRQTDPNGDAMSPRVFFWERKNYTLKIVNDLDFLADNTLIIGALKISPEQFRSNPLMLTNNLDDPNTWMDPVERAGEDAGGATQGPIFESRLRLRFAERILLQEIELASSPLVGDSNTFLTETKAQQPQGFGQLASKYQPQYQHATTAQVQLQVPDHPLQKQETSSKKRRAATPKPVMAKGASALEADYDEDESYFPEEEDGLNSGLADKSMWGVPDELRDADGKLRSTSGDSESAVRPSLPNSRSSSINNGLGGSAPSSSQSARPVAHLSSLRGVAPHQPPPQAHGVYGLGGSGPKHPSHHQHSSHPSASGTVSSSLDFGHDFFTGHWAESQPFLGSYDSRLDGGPSKTTTARSTNVTDPGIFFVDGGHLVDSTARQGATQPRQSHPLPQLKGLPRLETLDDASAHSLRSVDSVASVEVHALMNMRHPPRNLVLAASACVVLLTPGPEIPNDVSWGAFVKMCNKLDVASMIRSLDPLKVHKFKVLAIQPLLEQLLDDVSYEGLVNNTTPFHVYTAVNKLISWVQQFTAVSIAKQRHHKVPHILSPSAATAKRTRRLNSLGDSQSDGFGAGAGAGLGDSLDGPPDVNERLDITSLPTKKRVVPSASLQLAPFHSEVDSTLYKQPILIALLSTYDHKGQAKTKHKPRPPRSSKNAQPFDGDDAGMDRLVVKVYDVTGSAEYLHTLIIREYELLLDDLEEAYHNRAHLYFQPTVPAWWATHIKSVLVIEPKPGNKMKLKISRKAIEQLVADGLEHGLPPKPLIELKDLTPAPKGPLSPPSTSSPKKGPSRASPARPKVNPEAKAKVSDSAAASKPPLAKKASLVSEGPSQKSAAVGSVKATKPSTSSAARADGAPSTKAAKPSQGAASTAKTLPAPSASANGGASAKNRNQSGGPVGRHASPASAPRGTGSTKAVTPGGPTGSSRSGSAPKAAKKPSTAPTQPSSSKDGLSTEVPDQAPSSTDSPDASGAPPAAAEVANPVPISATGIDGEYGEDFENASQVEVGAETVQTQPRLPVTAAETPSRKAGVAGDYDEDFEEEISAAGTAGTADDAQTANTTGAVMSTGADTYFVAATQDGVAVGGKENDNAYYEDFEENSVDHACNAAIAASASNDRQSKEAGLDGIPYQRDWETNNHAKSDDAPLEAHEGLPIDGEGRPLSAIEQAQREFDEIGEDDGVFINSVDYDEEF